MREVCEDDFLVSSEINEAQVQYKLNDLETRDPLFPPDSDASGSQEIIPVHDNMNQQVQSDGHPRDRRQADQLRVAQ